MSYYLISFLNKMALFQRNIQTLATEIYKFLYGLSLTIMGDILNLNSPAKYNCKTCTI